MKNANTQDSAKEIQKPRRFPKFGVLDVVIILLVIAIVAGIYFRYSFFDTLNGMKADWNADQAYWAFYQGENYMSVGVNETVIEGGEHYRLVYTQ